MRYPLLFAFLFAGLVAQAQSNALQQFYKKYKGEGETFSLSLSGWIVRLAANHVEEKPAREVLKKVKHLRVMIMEDHNPVPADAFKQLLKDLRGEKFEDLMQIRDGGDLVQFMVKEKGDTINELLLLVHGDDEFVIIGLNGLFKYEELNDLMIEFEGGEHFKKLPERRDSGA